MIRRAVLNVSVGSWYEDRGADRLFNSLEEKGCNDTRLFWKGQYPPGSPQHDAAPYAFKPYAFKRARELGFHQALWLDASCWLRKPLLDVWARIDDDGYYLEPDGNYVGEWISDAALDLLGLSRDETISMPLIEGKCIGLDFREVGGEFLDEWLRIADAGGFGGAWSNENEQVSSDSRCRGHRHDIACGSPIADSFGMRLQTEKRVWILGGDAGIENAPDHVACYAQGM